MQLIGAGLSRTGTMSTQAALNMLGLPCYHMTEIPVATGHSSAWCDYLVHGTAIDWSRFFVNYEASVDTPTCFFYEELISAFPGAKVLLNVRDPDRWYASLRTLAETLETFRPLIPSSERLRQFMAITDATGQRLLNGDLSKSNCLQAYHNHLKAVKQVVPGNRLLEFSVQEGWQPLCDFLGIDVPDKPFPHLNEGEETIRQFVRDVVMTDVQPTR